MSEESRSLSTGVLLDGVDTHHIHVVRFDVRESLSHAYRVELEVYSTILYDIDSLLGKPGALVVRSGAGRSDRYFHGVVHEAALDATLPDRYVLRLVLGTLLEPLRLGRDCRIFQELSVPDVVKDVLSRAGVPDDRVSWELNESYLPHAYITQMNESDYDFVCRLLREVGIGFRIRNDIDAESVLFFDSHDSFEPVADDEVVPFASETGLRENVLLELSEAQHLGSDAVVVRDYDFEKAGVDLTSSAEADGSEGREVYLHPGQFRESADGDGIAQLELERLQLRQHHTFGSSDVVHLEPGRKLTIVDHPRVALDGDYYVLDVRHRGEREGASYRNDLVAIRSDRIYRPDGPARVAPPTGTEVAFVTGPSGAELHGSERGQVKVRFPWDRSGAEDDTSSTWLRVGQLPMPGPMIVPRVGFEVLVGHELADPDRPYVAGHLYNGEAVPPYELPGGATRTSIQTATTDGGAGANELRFEDSAGGEEIFINASYDYVASVEHDAKETVISNDSSSIGSNSVVTVGANDTNSVAKNQSTEVGGNMDANIDADYSDGSASMTLSVGGTRKLTTGGDLSEPTTGTLTRTIGGLQCVTGITGYGRTVTGASDTKVGAAMALMSAQSISSTCGGLRTELVGALKMIKAKTVAISCGAAYAENVASQTVKCGGDRNDTATGAIAVTASGGLSVKATNINITAESRLVLRIGGSSITITPGSVKIVAPKIEVKGTKALTSNVMHGTN